jgi:hypothetical protein
MRDRQGVTAVEVMIAVVLLGAGIIPVMGMLAGTSREAGFSEAHLLVQTRALTLLDCQEALGFDRTAGAAGDTEDLRIPVNAPPPPALPVTGAGGTRYAERLSFRRLDAGLGMLLVEISWVLATDRGRAGKPHVYRAFRVIAAADASWQHRMPLPLVAPPPAVAD